MYRRINFHKKIDLFEFEKIISSTQIDLSIKKLGIAFSGGLDSLALLFLLKKFSEKNKLKLISMIVDHGLRYNSSKDSIDTKIISEKIGVEARIFRWEGEKPRSGIMEKARDARYEILTDACKKLGIKNLFLAHHLDDQIETYLMREKRSKNHLGLACMESVSINNGVCLVRPFLEKPKKLLKDICQKNKLKWIEDPSNFNQKFERVRIRKYLQKTKLEKKIFIESRINYFRNKKKEMDIHLNKFIKEEIIFFPYGLFSFDRGVFKDCISLFQIELIRKLLRICSGKKYPPSYKSSKSLKEKIISGNIKNNTLHSCIVSINNNRVLIYRESNKTQNNVDDDFVVLPNEVKIWDHRFIVKSFEKTLHLKKIVNKDWNFIKKLFFSKCKRTLPLKIIKTLPLILIEENYFIPFICDKNTLETKGISFYFKDFNMDSKK